ncbi:hypothetical protein [Streptosporangium sp. NPDC000509]|uniref:hypothetical protein n=1 Tax=Streptosporangium sp. NPDC000509 TaxID=3366186 RepID=UPI0036A3576C
MTATVGLARDGESRARPREPIGAFRSAPGGGGARSVPAFRVAIGEHFLAAGHTRAQVLARAADLPLKRPREEHGR